jgi:hypothetical protein
MLSEIPEKMAITALFQGRAHKKGEVVGPAGGDTGGPHCLAEVYQPLKRGINSLFKRTEQENNAFKKSCQIKNKRTGIIRKVFIIHPTFY